MDREVSILCETEIVAEVDGQILVWVKIMDRECLLVFEEA
jgi:hypothetical protein